MHNILHSGRRQVSLNYTPTTPFHAPDTNKQQKKTKRKKSEQKNFQYVELTVTASHRWLTVAFVVWAI